MNYIKRSIFNFVIFMFQGSAGQLPAGLTPPNTDFYIPPGTTPAAGAFHTPGYLPPANILSFPTTTELTKLPYDNNSLTTIRNVPPSPIEQLSLRLSPASSRHSSSPHTNATSDGREQRIHSTLDQSNSEHSDDEDIDVVKSAFQPIKSTSTVPEVQHPDSTVQDKEPFITKCELKAPTIKKSLTSISPAKSPTSTKLHTAPTISTQKAVWRPY